LLEMSLSLALTGLVALSAMSVSSILQSPDLSPRSAADPKVALSRGLGWLDELVARSRAVGYVSIGSADEGAVLVLWHEDTFGDAAVSGHDFTIQLHELRLLRHDPTNDELIVYAPKDYATLTRSQKDAAAVTVTWDQFTTEAVVDLITATSWMQPMRIAGGPVEVLEADFSKSQSGTRPVVTYEVAVREPSPVVGGEGSTRRYRRSVSLLKGTLPEVWEEQRLLRAPDYSGAS
jgi:hypothetical protein